jgi:transposase
MENAATVTREQLESVQQECQILRQQNADLQAQVKALMEQLRLATHRRFGASRERTDENQLKLDLFNYKI